MTSEYTRGDRTRIELPMKAGELLQELNAMRVERPSDFDDLSVYLSVYEEGGIAREAAVWAVDPDAVSESDMAARGTVYRVQLHHAPGIEKWFVVIEGEDDDAFGDQPDEE